MIKNFIKLLVASVILGVNVFFYVKDQRSVKSDNDSIATIIATNCVMARPRIKLRCYTTFDNSCVSTFVNCFGCYQDTGHNLRDKNKCTRGD